MQPRNVETVVAPGLYYLGDKRVRVLQLVRNTLCLSSPTH